MSTKVVIGFVAGALIASSLTYFFSHRQVAVATPAVAVSTAPAPGLTPQEKPPETAAAPLAIPQPAPAKALAKNKPARAAAPEVKRAEPADVAEQPKQPEVATAPPPPPAPAPVPAETKAAEPAPEPPPAHTVTIPAGTLISARLGESLSSHRNRPGDSFMATLDQPLTADGFVIAERGARVEGRVVAAEEAGRVKGLARLAIELTKISTSDGQKIAIHTAVFEKHGPESKGQDAAKIGIGAALGSVIGAAAGGGKGAAIGAAAGGAAGTGTVMATRGKPAELPTETRISFKLEQPVTITERR